MNVLGEQEAINALRAELRALHDALEELLENGVPDPPVGPYERAVWKRWHQEKYRLLTSAREVLALTGPYP